MRESTYQSLASLAFITLCLVNNTSPRLTFDSIRFIFHFVSKQTAVNILPGVYTLMMQLNVGLTHTLA
jgi:hypothetical protein